MEELALQGRENIRLCDLLKLAGFCETSGVGKNIIADGVVKVDGKVELRKRAKIIAGQVIEYAGKKVKVV